MTNILRKRIERLMKGEDGAALVVTLALFMMMYISCAGVFAIGQTVREKMILQNAVDAAAYSAAIVQADALSRIATLNREMAWTYKDMVCCQMDYIVCKWLEDACREDGDVYARYQADRKISEWIGDVTWTIPESINFRDKIPPGSIHVIEESLPLVEGMLMRRIRDDSQTIDALGNSIREIMGLDEKDLYSARVTQVIRDVLKANLPDNYSRDCYWNLEFKVPKEWMEPILGGEANERRFLAFADLEDAQADEFKDWFWVSSDSLTHICDNDGFFKSSWGYKLKYLHTPLLHLDEVYHHVTKLSDDIYVGEPVRRLAQLNPARPWRLMENYFGFGVDSVRKGAISVGVAKYNRNPWARFVRAGSDGKKGLYEVFQPLVSQDTENGAIDWTWAVASAQAGYIDSRTNTTAFARAQSYKYARDYMVDWEGDDDWNLRTDNWDAVYVPVRQSFTPEEFDKWITNRDDRGWEKLASAVAPDDLPAYNLDRMTKVLPHMHNPGTAGSTLKWDEILGTMYH